ARTDPAPSRSPGSRGSGSFGDRHRARGRSRLHPAAVRSRRAEETGSDVGYRARGLPCVAVPIAPTRGLPERDERLVGERSIVPRMRLEGQSTGLQNRIVATEHDVSLNCRDARGRRSNSPLIRRDTARGGASLPKRTAEPVERFPREGLIWAPPGLQATF